MISINSDRAAYARRFGWCRDSMIKSYFEGIIGCGFAERENSPRWIGVRAGDYIFCAGEPINIGGLAEYILGDMGGKAVIVPEDAAGWLEALNDCGPEYSAVTRYHLRLPEGGLNTELLRRTAGSINGCMRLVRAGEAEYPLLRNCKWETFAANFKGMEDFLTNGFAYCIFAGDELASAASTFGYYSGGYELSIATDPKYRRRGLAHAAAAAFLLECQRRGKTPHWDAAHPGSARIAQRLGYIPDGEYTALKKK